MAGLFAAGLIGGFAGYMLSLPMPFLLGAVFGSAVFVFWLESTGARLKRPHPKIRLVAVAAIGAMIGLNVGPDLLRLMPFYWMSALAILPFMLLAHGGGYLIMRRLGGYRPVDAYYASMPGGLVEAVLLGEKAGADVQVLTVQHFVRVLAVVVIMSSIFSVMAGQPVGSAGGASFPQSAAGWGDVAAILALALVGQAIGDRLHLPAAHLMGPLLLAMGLSVSGTVAFEVPPWMLNVAQYVVGVGLGAQFSGMNRALLARGLRIGVLAVGYMLTLGCGFAYLLSAWVPSDVPTLFLAFAAGGVSEMSLIALSLDQSPMIVAAHHLIRIILAVWVANALAQMVLARRKTPPRA